LKSLISKPSIASQWRLRAAPISKLIRSRRVALTRRNKRTGTRARQLIGGNRLRVRSRTRSPTSTSTTRLTMTQSILWSTHSSRRSARGRKPLQTKNTSRARSVLRTKDSNSSSSQLHIGCTRKRARLNKGTLSITSLRTQRAGTMRSRSH